MIKYNNNTINDWNFGDDNIIKVYKHGAVCYYKITSGDTPTPVQEPCYAVVENISQYSDTEFEDVFNKADGKWYKLNNLNQYEEYGVYGSGRNITYYDGKLTIDGDYEYQYSGGSWVNVGEVSGGTATLPDVAFVLNYNAKYYDSSTNSMPYTEGQLNTVNAVKQYGAAVVDHSEDGYISVTGSTRFVTTGGTVGIDRNNTQTGCTMTIVSKARATRGEAVLTSRGGTSGSQMNWMWRYRTDGIFLHGSSSYNTKKYSVDTTTSPIIASVKTYYDGGVKQILKDWTNNGGYSGNFGYGSSYNGGSMFCDYLTNNKEFWKGDFYWVYMSQEVLTDEQIQQVIDYNEGGGGEPEYPIYYDEIQDPPDNLVFSSMAEAEVYECPWWGMTGIIDNTDYLFCNTNEWLTKYSYIEVSGDYLCDSGNKYKKMQEYDRNVDGTTSATTNYVKGDLIESGSTDCPQGFQGKWLATYTGGTTSSAECDSTSAITSGEITLTDLESVEIGDCVTSIGDSSFYRCRSLTSVIIPNSVASINRRAFSTCAGITNIEIPSSVTYIGTQAFYNCTSLASITINATTPPTLDNQAIYGTTCPIYVPYASVSTYQTDRSWSTYASRIQAIPNS